MQQQRDFDPSAKAAQEEPQNTKAHRRYYQQEAEPLEGAATSCSAQQRHVKRVEAAAEEAEAEVQRNTKVNRRNLRFEPRAEAFFSVEQAQDVRVMAQGEEVAVEGLRVSSLVEREVPAAGRDVSGSERGCAVMRCQTLCISELDAAAHQVRSCLSDRRSRRH